MRFVKEALEDGDDEYFEQVEGLRVLHETKTGCLTEFPFAEFRGIVLGTLEEMGARAWTRSGVR